MSDKFNAIADQPLPFTISTMPQKGNRSKRRQPRKGFPYRVVGYVDIDTHEAMIKAADRAGENISTFVARAVRTRATSILKPTEDK